MNAESLDARIAVCSWSLQPGSSAVLLDRLAAVGIRRVQLALDPLRASPAAWNDIISTFDHAGLTLVSGMFGCVGEDYSSLDSIRITGGIAPDSTWEQNLKNIRATAELASSLQIQLVTFHAGFLPHDPQLPGFQKMLERLGTVAGIFAVKGIQLGLETGQETADALSALLRALNLRNLGVNFDPANMLLYDKGDPVAAVDALGPWIRQVHIKDAQRTRIPGTWGEEVPVGSGEVNWKQFFSALRKMNYSGNFVIEREAGPQRIDDIRTAKAVIERFAPEHA